jgi:tetratricopeptide (TPR) repeat protein
LPPSRIASTRKATHVVTGRVGRTADGQHIAIDVQLSSVAEGDVIWAKHFEGIAGSGMAAAPDVGRQVVNAMRNRSSPNHRALAEAPNAKLDAVELTLLGWHELDRPKSMADVLRARTRFEAALREDPDSLIALLGLSASYNAQRTDPTSRLTAEQTTEHERLVERIRKIAPNDSTGLMMWGSVQMMRGRADLALPAFERASQLAPSYPNSYVLIGHALLLLGRAAEVQAVTERAIELGAGDPRRVSSAYQLAAEAALMLGDDHRAYELAGRSIAALPSNARGHASLAAIDALAGRSEQAATELAAFLKLWPAATVARYDELYRSTDPGYLHQRGRLYEGLRMAGLPER